VKAINLTENKAIAKWPLIVLINMDMIGYLKRGQRYGLTRYGVQEFQLTYPICCDEPIVLRTYPEPISQLPVHAAE